MRNDEHGVGFLGPAAPDAGDGRKFMVIGQSAGAGLFGETRLRHPRGTDAPAQWTGCRNIAKHRTCESECTCIPAGKNGGPEGPPHADPKASTVASSMNQRRDGNPTIGRRLYGKPRTRKTRETPAG